MLPGPGAQFTLISRGKPALDDQETLHGDLHFVTTYLSMKVRWIVVTRDHEDFDCPDPTELRQGTGFFRTAS